MGKLSPNKNAVMLLEENTESCAAETEKEKEKEKTKKDITNNKEYFAFMQVLVALAI